MKKWLLVLVCGASVAMASDHPKVDAALAECDAHVARLQAEFASKPAELDEKVLAKSRLRQMVAVDQYVRNFTQQGHARGFSPAENVAFGHEIATRMAATDVANTAEIKALLEKYGWFTISEFGAQADSDAWLLVQHADHDADFQREIVRRLEPLAARGETKPAHFALLFDRVALSYHDPAKRRPQRFGTQGRCTGPGTWEPFPVEDPDTLDKRRHEVGLPPMAEYKMAFKDICHESQEETLRKAHQPAAPPAKP
jgi:hypothetical protein